jgi:oxygen-independent coproporphyrinogen-3 oxidase
LSELAIQGVPPPVSLYVHFPFCEHRCHYCDFSVFRTRNPPLDEWLECIEREVEHWFGCAGWSRPLPLESVFVGGGTPSLMGDGMALLANILRRSFVLSPDSTEWTAESNPASLDRAVVRSWREAGVNRLSVGVQSFDDGVLRWLGRLHDAEGARRALAEARSAGFKDVNVDLMFGLPGSLERHWRVEVEAALEAGVTHVSTYGLTAEPHTPLGRLVESGEVDMVGEEGYAAEYQSAVEALEEAGFVHYEVSNFALPGQECLHNWHYWDGSPYLGLGPSAHSYVGGTRVWNVSRWEAYWRALAGGDSPLEGHELLGAGESRLERLWLALRTNRGIAAAEPLAELVFASAGDLLDAWREAGWVVLDDTGVRLTAEGWLRMDELVTALGGRIPATTNGSGLRKSDDVRQFDRA